MTQSHQLTRDEELRVFAGFAVQPFVAGFLAFAVFPIVDFTGRALYGGQPVDRVDAAISLGVGVGIAALLVTILGALPMFAWLLERGQINRRQVMVSGAILGNAPSVVIVLSLVVDGLIRKTPIALSHLTYGLAGLIRAIALGSFIGVVSASAFWLLAGRHLGMRSRAASPGGSPLPG